jgi:hypothetical protein
MAGVGDTITRLKPFDAFSDGIDDAGAFITGRKWKIRRVFGTSERNTNEVRPRRFELTSSQVDIDKVDPCRMELNAHFTWSRVRQIHIAEAQSIRPTILLDTHRFHGFVWYPRVIAARMRLCNSVLRTLGVP